MQIKEHWCFVFNRFLCFILELSTKKKLKKVKEKFVLKIWSQNFEEKNA